LKKIQAILLWVLSLDWWCETSCGPGRGRQHPVLALRQRKRGHRFLGNPLACFKEGGARRRCAPQNYPNHM